ncbi:MAG TPA: DsbA family protein [Rhizomicrobium sp.]|nr:DsbA family protein [Rhizomicrobium sp.]
MMIIMLNVEAERYRFATGGPSMPVQFYLDYRSPYSYLAQSQLDDVALEIFPFDVLDVMKRVDNTPTTITCAVKNRYASADLGRWVARYKIPLAPNPKMREIDARRLLRATLAVTDAGERRKATRALFNAMWGIPAALGTVDEVADVLTQGGVNAAAIKDQFDAPELDTALEEANAAAAERGVFGSPTFFVGKEMFFGNDRLDFLRAELKGAA